MRRGRVVVVVATAALLSGCDPAERAGAPRAAVTQSGDTTIIVPALDGPTGRLVSDLVIGADESNPDAIFGRVADAAFGPDGEIYVVDAQASAVSVFGRDGEFSGFLSRDGDGPGEVHEPEMISVGPDGSVAVVSLREVALFDPDGAPRATVRRSEVRRPIRFDTEAHLRVHHGPVPPPVSGAWQLRGNGVQGVYMARGPRRSFHVVTLAEDGSPIDSVAAPFDVDDLPCVPPPDVPTQKLCVFFAYAATPWFDWLPDGRRIDGDTGRYRIDVSDPDGDEILSLRPPRDPRPLPRDFAAHYRANWVETGTEAIDTAFTPPTRMPAIAQALPSRDGWILIRIHAEPELTVDEDGDDLFVEPESRFDIFTPEGEHRGYVTGPADLTVRDMRGDTLLTTRAGPFGIPIVERFVIEWSNGTR